MQKHGKSKSERFHKFHKFHISTVRNPIQPLDPGPALCLLSEVANPGEHLERLLGRPPPHVVARDGSPSGGHIYVLWNPMEVGDLAEVTFVGHAWTRYSAIQCYTMWPLREYRRINPKVSTEIWMLSRARCPEGLFWDKTFCRNHADCLGPRDKDSHGREVEKVEMEQGPAKRIKTEAVLWNVMLWRTRLYLKPAMISTILLVPLNSSIFIRWCWHALVNMQEMTGTTACPECVVETFGVVFTYYLYALFLFFSWNGFLGSLARTRVHLPLLKLRRQCSLGVFGDSDGRNSHL